MKVVLVTGYCLLGKSELKTFVCCNGYLMDVFWEGGEGAGVLVGSKLMGGRFRVVESFIIIPSGTEDIVAGA